MSALPAEGVSTSSTGGVEGCVRRVQREGFELAQRQPGQLAQLLQGRVPE
jgi:hypothetical protein